MSDFSTLDCFRELVPSWPWKDFPKPPACVLELVDAIGSLRDLIAVFADTGNLATLQHARINQAQIADAFSRLGKFGFYKDRKRTIRRTRKDLKPIIDLLEAQMALLNAAYPPTLPHSPRSKMPALVGDEFSATAGYAIASIKNAAGTSY